MTQIQQEILQIIQAMFAASPGKQFLDDFEAVIAAGATTTDLANSLADSAAFKALRYSDTLTNNQFATALLEDILGDLVTTTNKGFAVTEIESLLDSGLSRGEIFVQVAAALSSISPSDPAWGAAAAQFANKVDVSAFYALDQEGSGLTLNTLQQVTANVTDSAASVTAAKALLESSISGEVIDGYVRDAIVFIDKDGDGTQDPGEISTTTDAQGKFSFPAGVSGFGQIIASGGTDISTGQAFAGQLTAPAGSSVVTPLTTLIDKLASGGMTVTAAKAIVSTSLGLDPSVDLTNFDAIGVSTNTATDAATITAALKIQAAAAKINTLVTQIAALLNGASVSTDQDAGISSAYVALASNLASNTGAGAVDLSELATITNIINGAASAIGANTAALANIANLANGASTVISNLNTAVDAAVAGSGDALSILVRIVSIQVVSKDVESSLQADAASGFIFNAVLATVDNVFLDAISTAGSTLGDIDGNGTPDTNVGSSDDGIIIPGDSTTFAVTQGGAAGGTGTVTFSNVTGAVTLTVNSSGFLVFTDAAPTAKITTYNVADMATGGIPAVTLSATTFALTNLSGKLADGSAAVDTAGASAAEITVLAGGVAQIAVGGISNLTVTNAQSTAEITALLGKATGALVTADSMDAADLAAVATNIANIANGGITGTMVLSTAVLTDTQISALLGGQTSAGTTVNVDATGMTAADLTALSTGIAKVDSITNLTVTNAQSTAEITALLGKATVALVTADSMDSADLAAVATNIANVATNGITGTMVLNTAVLIDSQIAALLGPQTAAGTTVNVNSTDMTAAAAKALLTSGVSGEVIDGYVRGATVFIDKDGDGIQDPGELSTTTDALGNFSFPAGTSGLGQIIASGGTDIATGLPFAGKLTAPAGSTVVTPLTTLIDKIASASGVSVTAAKASVAASLGLDAAIDLTKFDPLEVSSDTTKDAATRNAAIKIQAAAVKINTLVTQTAALLNGAAVSTDQNAGINAAYAALASKLASNTGNTAVDLSAAGTITGIINGAASAIGANSDQLTNIANLAGGASTVISNLNTAINTAIADSADPASALVQFASIQVVSNDVESTLISGAAAGSTVDAIAATSDTTFQTAITTASNNLGDIDGDGVVDAVTPTPTPTPTPTTFTVTETAGAVTFGGTATGNITIAWVGTVGASVATFTRGGLDAATKPDFSGTATTITLASGQVLSASYADATAIAVTATKT
ncbi:MAG: hypothetical protein ACI8V0_002419, partial [Pseudohongiellaceae bacterium]